MEQSRDRIGEPLQVRAMREDTESCRDVELGWLFASLVDGTLKASSEFLSSERCYLVVVRAPAQLGCQPLSHRRRAVLERTLSGCLPQKVTASDVGRSVSSISSTLKAALQFMGLSCGAARVPLILVLAARHHLSGIGGRAARLSSFVHQGATHWVVSVARPDLRLRDRLPSAEFEVTRLLVEGKSHLEIARARGTSQRTIANQLRSVFQRLDVSGRLELLSYLATAAARTAQPDVWFAPRALPANVGQSAAAGGYPTAASH